jgi:hypothetical protein
MVVRVFPQKPFPPEIDGFEVMTMDFLSNKKGQRFEKNENLLTLQRS